MGNKRPTSVQMFFFALFAVGLPFIFLGVLGINSGNQTGNAQDVMRSTWFLFVGVLLWILCTPYVMWKLRKEPKKG